MGLLCTLAGGQRSGRPLEGSQEGEGATETALGFLCSFCSPVDPLAPFSLETQRPSPKPLPASVHLKSSIALLCIFLEYLCRL